MRQRIRELFLKRTKITFFISNFVLLLWAITGILLIYNVQYGRKKMERFVRQHLGFDLMGLMSITISSAILIFGALNGLLGSIFTKPIVLCCYRSILACSVTLKVFAFIWAGSLLPLPKMEKYVKAFDLGSLYLLNRGQVEKVWREPVMFWNLMQEELQCCGIYEYRDWIHSRCQCIPNTCCIPSKFKECEAEIHDNDNNKFFQNLTFHEYERLKELTWPENCVSVLRGAMNSLHTTLMLLSLLALLTDVILNMWCCHLLKMLEFHMKKPSSMDSDDLNSKFVVWLLGPNESLFHKKRKEI